MNILQRIKNLFLPFEKMSDGYHSFEELYDHRDALFIELCKAHKDKSWYSAKHHDGNFAYGYPWVIMGIGTEPNHQISYHVNTKQYRYFDIVESKIKKLPFAPIWDKHTSKDVIFRLQSGDYLK